MTVLPPVCRVVPALDDRDDPGAKWATTSAPFDGRQMRRLPRPPDIALDVDVVRAPSDVSLPRRLLTIHDTVEHWLDTPSEVKAAVTGNGSADKAQVTTMITKILAPQAKPTPPDAAGALALAICHCWRAPMIAPDGGGRGARRRAAQEIHGVAN